MHKVMDIENLYKDLGYVLFETYVQNFLFQLCPPREGIVVVEPGSGSGKMGIGYALRGCKAVLIDVDWDALRYSTRLYEAALALKGIDPEVELADYLKLECQYKSIFDMKLSDFADLVFNEGVVQHWPEDEKRQAAINEMVKVCKPGGIVCIIGSNGRLESEREVDRTMKFTYEGMPPIRRCFTNLELFDKLGAAGLEQVQAVPIDGSPLLAGWGIKRAT